MVIALDAMGGDFAPTDAVQGAVLAASQLEAQIALVGNVREIEQALGGASLGDQLIIREATEVVAMDESPRTALRGKPDSSVARTVEMVRQGEAKACISVGNSGAFMMLCHTRLRTIPGIQRPAIAFFVPTPSGPRVVLDAGANADCKPLYLQQFGIMGSIYAELHLGLKNPRIALLSIGSEDGKGNELTQAAFPLLQEAPINFVGNVEGDGVFLDDVDVIVTDGFVGNVLLKVAEGTGMGVMGLLKEGVAASLRGKIGAYLLKDVLGRVRDLFDYSIHGGALLLGVNGVCIVGHGKSDATAIKNAILMAERTVKGEVVEHVQEVCRKFFPT